MIAQVETCTHSRTRPASVLNQERVSVVVGILQFELLIHDPSSLKDKRRVVRSVKDRLHRDHQVSVAEVAMHDRLDRAILGLALVGHEGRRVGQVLDQILEKLRALHDAELGDITREVLQGVERVEQSDRDLTDEDADALAAELLSSFEDDGEQSS